MNLGEGLDLLFKDSSADKEAVFKELFFTSEGRLNRKSYIYRSFFPVSGALCGAGDFDLCSRYFWRS